MTNASSSASLDHSNNTAEDDAATTANTRSTTPVLTVASLRRSNSSHHSPTRVLRLTEQEERARTPPVVNVRISHRPRSNPRTRTPRRAESPLDPNALRSDQASQHHQQQRITIRTNAGRAVGSLAPIRIREEDEDPVARSAKQGPSHRKVRRWNNDHFDQLADELAHTSLRAARVLHEGRAHAHEYREIINLNNTHSTTNTISKLLQDEKLASVRKEFMEGGGGSMIAPTPHNPRSSKLHNGAPLSGPEMLRRIDPRLRRVVTKAATNSLPASRVMKTVETFLLQVFAKIDESDSENENEILPKRTTRSVLANEWWKDVLLEAPNVRTTSNNNNGNDNDPTKTNPTTEAQFYFHPTHPTGGFHRLLLHAVAQFHGLSAVSRLDHDWTPAVTNSSNSLSPTSARALTVRGRPVEGKYRLLDVLTNDESNKGGDSVVRELGASATWEVV